MIFRSLQPPKYGDYDFAVIDFNVDPPMLTQLAEAVDIWLSSYESPVTWHPDGFLLRYHGAAIHNNEEHPKKASHEAWFDFDAKEVSLRK